MEEQLILKPFSDGLRPIPRLTVSQWSDGHRFLTSMSSAEPGRYRTDRTPGVREIADCLGKTSDVQEIIVMKGAQLGLTEMGNNWIGYVMDINPGPFLLVMPTDAAIKKNSRTRIKPMIESTPTLKNKIRAAGSKEAGNTIDSKEFPGGVLLMVGANSPVGLSSTPVGNLMLDEVDRFPKSAGEEGSPVDLAKARTRTFANKKILMISTPTNEGESVIAGEFKNGDQRYYNVACIHCKKLFVITWDCFTWEEGKPETVRCACSICGGLHEERHKTFMFSEDNGAKWIPTATSSNPRRRSYHYASWYSSAGFYSWEDMIRDWELCQGDANKERTFINTVKGETYKIKGDAPAAELLYNRREDYPIGKVPDPVYFLTMGVDIQGDRIEAEVVGWSIGRTSYSIDYKVLLGDTSKPEVWELLRELINTQFECEDGSYMSINLTCIDAGYNTKTVYDFTSKFSYNKVIPIMGRATEKISMVSQPRAINVGRSGKKIEGAKVWYLGTSLLKSELYGFLKLQAAEDEHGVETYPPGYCHFPEYDRHYFKMLTAEELRMETNKKGYTTFEWVKKFERNEALDIRCYARAAAFIIGIDRFKDSAWESIKTKSKTIAVNPEDPKPKKEKKPPRSDYWNRK